MFKFFFDILLFHTTCTGTLFVHNLRYLAVFFQAVFMELPFARRSSEDRQNDGMLRREILRAQPGSFYQYRYFIHAFLPQKH